MNARPRSTVSHGHAGRGNASLARLRSALTPGGTPVIVGGEGDGRWFSGIDRQLRATLLSPFVGQALATVMNKENHEIRSPQLGFQLFPHLGGPH